MTLGDTLVTGAVLIGLFILAYVRLANKTLLELFKEIKEVLMPDTEEVNI